MCPSRRCRAIRRPARPRRRSGPAVALPGTSAQPAAGCHSHSSPVERWKLVATKPPSGSADTEFRPTPSGATAQPTQVAVGASPRASISKTSTDSRAPWRTTYSVCTWLSPGRKPSPCGRKPLVSGPGQAPKVAVSCRGVEPSTGKIAREAWSRVSVAYRWPSSAMLETMTHGESGTAIRSSGFSGPQTNFTSPSGSHCAAPSVASARTPTTASDDTSNVRILMPPPLTAPVAGPRRLCHLQAERRRFPGQKAVQCTVRAPGENVVGRKAARHGGGFRASIGR